MKEKLNLNNITEQYTNFISNVDEKTKYYIFIGVLLFVFLLDYLVLMRPQLGNLTKMGPEISVTKDDLEKTKSEIQRINFYKNEVEKLKKQFEEANLRLRSREEVPLIIEKISGIAADSGLKISQVMPDPQNQQLLLDNKDRHYYSLPIILDLDGEYHGFARFINKIENEPIAIKIKKFTITGIPESRKSKLAITLEAIIFDEGQTQIKDEKKK